MDKDEIARRIAKRSPNKDPSTKHFSVLGGKVAESIAAELDRHRQSAAPNVLEFGCGSGRVCLPLAKMRPDAHFSAVDVDQESVDYINLAAPPNLQAKTNGYTPPLQFDDNSFDFIYSISVWTHFPEKLGISWLQEIRRVLKEGCVAAISVNGQASLASMRRDKKLLWRTPPEELESAGFIYREMANLGAEGLYPGVSESWGDSLMSRDYIMKTWGQAFRVEKIIESFLPGTQDMVVVRK